MGGEAGEALAACGTSAWFASNHTLIRIDADKGVVGTYQVPAATSVASIDSYRPPELKGLSGVSALACGGPVPVLAVAVSNSASSYTFDVSSHSFAPVALPPDADAVDAAVDSSGDAAFGLLMCCGPRSHDVLVHHAPGGADTVVPVESPTPLVSDGNGFTAGVRLERVSPGPAQPGVFALTAAQTRGVSPLVTRPSVLGDGRVVMLVNGVVEVLDPAAAAPPLKVSFGSRGCLPSNATGPVPEMAAPADSSTTLPVSCPVVVTRAVVDDFGHLYAVDGFGQTSVREASLD